MNNRRTDWTEVRYILFYISNFILASECCKTLTSANQLRFIDRLVNSSQKSFVNNHYLAMAPNEHHSIK